MRNVLALVVALLLSAAAMAGGASPALAENAPNGYPYCGNKSGDAANFGILKQNWLMLRSACQYGINTWFAGHRNGATGLSNPDTGDINGYKAAIYWIQNQINSNAANLGNDTRFWVDVRPI